MSGKTTKMKDDTFYEINPWITFEKWNLYRVAPQTINGQKHNILVYTSRYDGGNYYRSKKLAKQMKNYKFEKLIIRCNKHPHWGCLFLIQIFLYFILLVVHYV